VPEERLNLIPNTIYEHFYPDKFASKELLNPVNHPE